MSSAQLVPETWELTGDDARKTLLNTGRRKLVRDAFVRLRTADGFSHARSLAFLIALVSVQGIIALVGLATLLGHGELSRAVVGIIHQAVPGPAGTELTKTVEQAKGVGGSDQYLGLEVGLAGTLITATTLMGQIERALNRLYGVEKDRPTMKKYGLAFLLAVTAGGCATLAFAIAAFGHSISGSLQNGTPSTAWNILRWPLALGLIMSAVALLLRWAPRRHQPAWSWLAFGSTLAVILWAGATLLLSLYFQLSSSFGRTYGPLAGTVALLLWAFLSAVALLFGAAVAAQLEAVRAGAPSPQGRTQPDGVDPRSLAGAH
jgi:YihY family inner membrane protein